jgi:protein phosphatase 2C-like protein
MVNVLRTRDARWSAVGATARGALHVRTGLANQDHHGGTVLDAAPDGLAIAVADGHGDPRCVRADVGARLAVSVALRAARALPGNATGVPSEIAERIVAGWRAEVSAHRRQHPLPAGAATNGDVDAYGATLLLAIVLADHLTLVQIGDGDILLVRADGSVRCPVPARPGCAAGATDSLAADDAAAAAAGLVVELDPAHELVLLATDGYGNSFAEREWWHDLGADYVRLLNEHGMPWLGGQLPAWLHESAQAGGDDATVMVAARVRSPG